MHIIFFIIFQLIYLNIFELLTSLISCMIKKICCVSPDGLVWRCRYMSEREWAVVHWPLPRTSIYAKILYTKSSHWAQPKIHFKLLFRPKVFLFISQIKPSTLSLILNYMFLGENLNRPLIWFSLSLLDHSCAWGQELLTPLIIYKLNMTVSFLFWISCLRNFMAVFFHSVNVERH